MENINLKQAMKALDGFQEKQFDLPFVHFKSLSKGEMFPLFIAKQSIDTHKEGKFSCYGLSPYSSVPDF